MQLLPGTDSAYGFPALREVELYVEAGLSPARALALATLERWQSSLHAAAQMVRQAH